MRGSSFCASGARYPAHFLLVRNMAFVEYNPNPYGKKVGDCTIRALAKALGKTWGDIFVGLAFQGFQTGDMMNANSVWGAYLFENGFIQEVVSNTCPDCYTVKDFCEDNPEGTFVLATGSHVVAVEDGNYYDLWDSGDETIAYIWRKEKE